MSLDEPMLSVEYILNPKTPLKKSTTFMQRLHKVFDLFGQCKFSFKKKKKPKIPGHHLQEYYMNYDGL